MFKLRKLHPPFGSRDTPFIDAAYSEGAIRVVDGLCEVKELDTRNTLLMRGYADVPLEASGKGKGRR